MTPMGAARLRPTFDADPVAARVWRSSPYVWLWLSVAAAVLAMAANVVGLTNIDRIYGTTYPSLVDQAIAQDLVDLVVVGPTLVVLVAMTRRGSLRAYLAWLGMLVFTVYNYVIYTFAIHFGPLFLVWVGVLGLATYALIGGVAAVDATAVRARFGRRSFRSAGWFLIVMATLFGVLWLSDILPAQLSGDVPAAVVDLGVPTNPVHVLDLALFLPAAFVAGVLLLRRRALAYVAGPALVLFLALTGLPILVTPFVAAARGSAATWGILAPIGVVTVASLVVLGHLLQATEKTPGPIESPRSARGPS